MPYAQIPMFWPSNSYGSAYSAPISQDFMNRSRSPSSAPAGSQPETFMPQPQDFPAGIFRALDDIKRDLAAQLLDIRRELRPILPQTQAVSRIQQQIDTQTNKLESLRATVAGYQRTQSAILTTVQGLDNQFSALQAHVDHQIVESADTIIAALGDDQCLSPSLSAPLSPRPSQVRPSSPGPALAEREIATALWVGGWRDDLTNHEAHELLEQVLHIEIHKLTRLTIGSAIIEVRPTDAQHALSQHLKRHAAFSQGVKIATARSPPTKARLLRPAPPLPITISQNRFQPLATLSAQDEAGDH